MLNRIFYFEKHHDTVFKSPKEYDQRSLVMLDNHDVPTLTSWLKGDDITLRYRLKMLKDDEEYNYLKSLRIEEQRSLLSHLIENGVWPIEKSEPQTVSFELLSAIIHWVASTESVFFVLQIEDLIMMDEPVNLPGTYLEHKNWSRKLTQDLEDIFSQSHIINLLKSVHDIRYADQGENK